VVFQRYKSALLDGLAVPLDLLKDGRQSADKLLRAKIWAVCSVAALLTERARRDIFVLQQLRVRPQEIQSVDVFHPDLYEQVPVVSRYWLESRKYRLKSDYSPQHDVVLQNHNS
jgi:hypothetical protein